MCDKKIMETWYERNAAGDVIKEVVHEYWVPIEQSCDEDCACCDQCGTLENVLEDEAELEFDPEHYELTPVKVIEVDATDVLHAAAAALTFISSVILLKKVIKLPG